MKNKIVTTGAEKLQLCLLKDEFSPYPLDAPAQRKELVRRHPAGLLLQIEPVHLGPKRPSVVAEVAQYKI